MKKSEIIILAIKNNFSQYGKLNSVKAPLLKRAWAIEEKENKDEKIIIGNIFTNIFDNPSKYEKKKVEKKPRRKITEEIKIIEEKKD